VCACVCVCVRLCVCRGAGGLDQRVRQALETAWEEAGDAKVGVGVGVGVRGCALDGE
jgi:hypothetical protein